MKGKKTLILLALLGCSLYLLELNGAEPGIPSEMAHYFRTQESVIESSPDLSQIILALDSFGDPVAHQALIDLSPNTYGILEWINARNNSLVASILSQHRLQLCCSNRDCFSVHQGFYLTPFCNVMDNSEAYNQLYRFNATAGGVLLGYDYCWSDFYVGGAFAYTKTFSEIKQTESSGTSNSYYGALYGSWDSCYVTIDLSAIAGGSSQEMDRIIQFPTVDRTAHSDHWGHFVTGHLGLSSEVVVFGFWIQPFALTDYHYLREEAFKEQGAGDLNLDMRAKTQQLMRAEAGMRTRYEILESSYCFAPYLGLSWVGEFPLHHSTQKGTISGAGGELSITSYWSMQNLISPEAGIQFEGMSGLAVFALYKGLFNQGTRIHQGEFRVEWTF